MSWWWRLVRFGFRLLYNELAFTYDLVSWIVSLGSWRCWVRASLKHVEIGSAERVLELAHGTGNLQIDLNGAGYRTIGYDLSPAMGRIARRKLTRHYLPVRLARGRAQQLPFAAETFAAVISTFPTDFIVAPETLAEVHRVLKADGRLIVVPNAQITGGGRLGSFIEWLYRITGQRQMEPNPVSLASLFAPFQVEVFTEVCSRSAVTVIVARKTE